MIRAPYTYIRSNGEARHIVFEYQEVDSFDNIDHVLCRQTRAVTCDPELRKCFIQHNGSGDWGHPGGTIEPGEGLVESLARELVEETNTELLRAIPIGYQRVVDENGAAEPYYQLRYVAIVRKIADFVVDPDCATAVCREIDFVEIPEYVHWNAIGDRIYEQAREVLCRLGHIQ